MTPSDVDTASTKLEHGGEAMKFSGHVDTPSDGDLVQRHGFQVEGWAHVGEIEHRHVEAFVDGVLVGATELSHSRPDVALAFRVPEMLDSGFTFACSLPEQLRDRQTLRLRVVAVGASGEQAVLGERWLRLSHEDYRQHGHGDVLRDGATKVLRRDDVYGSGPPSPLADGRVVELVRRYLRKSESILDVGCGIGAFGRVLAPEGYDWTGCEVREDFCATVRAVGLRAEAVVGTKLPFDDGSFGSALCIEVLEHIDDFNAFLAEIRRVVTRRAVFSVPNFESIPVMSANYAIPWHMLESDHKNFFTRQSLATTLETVFAHVEVFEYGALAQFRTSDQLSVYNHLFAIADVR